MHTSGRAWAYQPSPLNATKIARGLADLSTAWSTASLDKSVRPVFTIASGPGTGKSRLLDELPRLCCASAAASSPSLASSLKRAFIFKVSFENGTPYDAAAEAALDGDSLIGTRMKWQLTDSTTTSYSAFQSRSPCTIEDALDDLSAISHIPRDKQFVFLIVDGLQKLLPVQIARSAAPLDPVKFRSAINAVSACVNSFPECIVGAIAATLAIPIREAFGVFSHGGSQQARIYLEPPPLFRPADVVPDIPEMPLLGVLRDDMGGHGRALELLASSLYTFGTDELRPFSSVATSVIAGLSSKFEEWTSAAGVKQLWEPLLNAVIARRRLALSDVVPGTEWTVDRVRSLGLVRFVTADTASGLSASGYLDMAVALLQVIRAELRPGPLTTLVPDYAFMESTSRVAKSWQDFEDLVANFRAIKVAAFQDMAQVSLSELHAGAKLSAVAAATVVRVPSGPNVAVRVLHPTTRYSTATFRLDANSFDVIGRVDEEPAALRDVVLNGVSASAGDIFLRLDRLERSSGKFIPELEVLACRHRQADVNAMAFDEELYKAFGDRRSTSFFLFVTSARVQVDLGAADLAKSEGDGHGSASAGYQTRSFSVRVHSRTCLTSFTRRFPQLAVRLAPHCPGSAPRWGACRLH